MFKHFGAEAFHQEKELICSDSNLLVLGNNVQVPPLHGALKENNVSQLQEVNEMLVRLVQLKPNLETGGTLAVGSPFSTDIQKEVLPINVRQPHLEQYEGLTDPEDH